MPAATDILRVRRSIDELVASVALDLRPGSKTAMTPIQRRALKAEIESCMQALDELNARLSG